MIKNRSRILKQALKQIIYRLLGLGTFQFAVLFLVAAVIVSVMIVLTIDLLWDGHFNPELEFAGVITPFLDGFFLIIFITAMFEEIHEEVKRRESAEEALRKLNEELEEKVKQRTEKLLEMQDELVRKEKLAVLGQVASSVGHELRNPLGVLSNAVYFLKTVLPDTDGIVIEYLDMMNGEIANADRIVSDLLDAVRAKPSHVQSIAVGELIDLTLRQCHIPQQIHVRKDIPLALPPVQADTNQMQQVLRNLVTNAVEAMPEGGGLEFEAFEDRSSGSIKIAVHDTGVGIRPENLASLFQPLFTTKPRGIGLGLMVVKRLTEANGGTVEVESEPGRGTRFTVALPVGQ